MVRQEPPQIAEQMRPWQCGNVMPSELVEVQVLHTIAVNVDIVIAGQPLEAFGDGSFRAVALIDER